MATTTTTTPNAPDLLTLVTDTESIVSSIDTLTSYLDSELAPSTAITAMLIRGGHTVSPYSSQIHAARSRGYVVYV